MTSGNAATEFNIKNPTVFSIKIETMAANRGLTHVEALMEFCSDHMLDFEDVVPLISRSLKDKIEYDFRQLGYLPRKAQLDIF